MARRKRATALFEVISKSRQYRPARPATARSGNWFSHAATWFVRPKLQPIPTGSATRVTAAQEMEYDEGPVAVFEEPDENAPPIEPLKPEAASLPTINQDVAHALPSQEENVHVTMDRDQKEIRLKLSYSAAAVAGMALVGVICLSVMIGQRFNRNTLPLLAQTTTDELRRGPAHREVLDPPRRAAVVTPARAVIEPKTVPSTSNNTNDSSTNPPLPANNRYIGMNYVVIQSYPKSEAALAEKTATFLNNHGVNCTIEKKVSGFMELSVVGLDGFPKRSSPEYIAYVDHIKKLNSEFTTNSRSVKSFDPIGKRWEKQD